MEVLANWTCQSKKLWIVCYHCTSTTCYREYVKTKQKTKPWLRKKKIRTGNIPHSIFIWFNDAKDADHSRKNTATCIYAPCAWCSHDEYYQLLAYCVSNLSWLSHWLKNIPNKFKKSTYKSLVQIWSCVHYRKLQTLALAQTEFQNLGCVHHWVWPPCNSKKRK